VWSIVSASCVRRDHPIKGGNNRFMLDNTPFSQSLLAFLDSGKKLLLVGDVRT
jgi:hypothetical protein